jgi:hypothetical protein
VDMLVDRVEFYNKRKSKFIINYFCPELKILYIPLEYSPSGRELH